MDKVNEYGHTVMWQELEHKINKKESLSALECKQESIYQELLGRNPACWSVSLFLYDNACSMNNKDDELGMYMQLQYYHVAVITEILLDGCHEGALQW